MIVKPARLRLEVVRFGGIAGIPAAPLPLDAYNLGVNPTDLNSIAIGAAAASSTSRPTSEQLDRHQPDRRDPGLTGFISNVIWQDSQHIWIVDRPRPGGSA